MKLGKPWCQIQSVWNVYGIIRVAKSKINLTTKFTLWGSAAFAGARIELILENKGGQVYKHTCLYPW